MTQGRSDDTWLATHLTCLHPTRTLELGCGEGRDSRWLLDHGVRVLATDLSESDLRRHADALPTLIRVRLDIGAGLPFLDGAFNTVLASLSLHYFARAHTLRIAADIRRCLLPGGTLLLRVNSREDVYYGARGHTAIEPHVYRVHNRAKRFFDAADIHEIAAHGWRLDHLRADIIDRYDRPKHVWSRACNGCDAVVTHPQDRAKIRREINEACP